MDLSKLRSRRNILALALAGAAARVAPVRAAQSTAGCDIGFTNGLVTIGGADCELLGSNGANVGLPIQLVDDRGSGSTSSSGVATSSQGTSTTGVSTTSSPTTTTSSVQAERQAELQKKRDKKRTKRGRQTTKRKTKSNKKQTQKQTRRDGEEESARLANVARCSGFTTQKEAVEYIAQYGDDDRFLDSDRDGMACENLPPVTCDQFTTQPEAQSWWRRHDFTTSKDPYGLYDADAKKVCPLLPTPAVNG